MKLSDTELNKSKLEKYLIIFCFFLALLSLGGLWSSVSIFLPTIQEVFGINIIGTALLFVVMLLPVLFTEIFILPFKKFGKKIIVLCGILILTLFGIIHPFITNYPILLLFRFIAAAGFGILFKYHNQILAEYCPPSQNPINTLIMMSGLVTGAFGSSYFTIYLYNLFNENWKLSVAFWGFLGLITTILWIIFLIKTEILE